MPAKISETPNELRSIPVQRPGFVTTSLYSLLFVFIEILAQTVGFSFRHFNPTKQFPFSSATIVWLIELTKFVLCFLAFCGQYKRLRFVPSLVFLIPAFFFVAAGNLFYYCMNFVSPPTWNVLVQSRTMFTALGGYVVFGRPIGRRVWLAIAPLLLAACLAVWFCPAVDIYKPLDNNVQEGNVPTRSLWWTLAVLSGGACSAFSVGSAEFISKLGSRPMSEKYIQLHFFCTILSFIWAELDTDGTLFEVNSKMFFPLDFYLALLNLIVGTLGGLAVTYIAANRLASSTDGTSWAVTPWIPPFLFLTSTAVCLIIFPTQQGYPHAISAAIALLMCSASFLCSTSSTPPAEQAKVGLKQEA